MDYRLIEAHQCFGGIQSVYAHWSDETQSEMRFAIYLPPAAEHQYVPTCFGFQV